MSHPDPPTGGAHRVLEFRAALEKNRQIFSLQYPFAYFAFFGLCEAFDRVGRRLQTGRDSKGKSYVSLIPFLLIVQRQAMSAFEALASCRSYEAWMLIRPALEATLIIGKWVDDPDNAVLWSDREVRRHEYASAYTGKGLVSKSLPRSAEIRMTLGRLNDEFVHTNVAYYSRHTNAQPAADGDIFLRLEFFDDGEDTETHACAFLHLLAVLADSLDNLFASVLPTTGASRPITSALEQEIGERALKLRTAGKQHAVTLAELGLWAG